MQETPVWFLDWEDPLKKGTATHSSILEQDGILFGHKKDEVPIYIYSNFENITLSEHRRSYVLWFHLYEIFRIDKSIETESKLVIARGWDIRSDYYWIAREETATHSSILAWRIPWTEEPGGLQSMGLKKSQTWLSTCPCVHTHINGYRVSFGGTENVLAWEL